MPGLEYGSHYMSAYEIGKLIAPDKDGQAVIEALFTTKGETLYAIAPRWPGRELVLRLTEPPEDTVVTLLGHDGKLPWRYEDGAMHVEMPALGVEELPCDDAYGFKIGGAAALQVSGE